MTDNVYAAPKGDVIDEQVYGQINFFSPASRLNRLRYWAHISVVLYGFCLVAGLAVVLGTSVSQGLGYALGGAAYLGFLVYTIIAVVQRLHDTDKSGWLWLLNFVPLVNLYLVVIVIFFPGTPGPNRFGPPTPPNKTWHWLVAFSFPLIVGVLAAISLPAYQQYVERAKAAQVAPIPMPDNE